MSAVVFVVVNMKFVLLRLPFTRFHRDSEVVLHAWGDVETGTEGVVSPPPPWATLAWSRGEDASLQSPVLASPETVKILNLSAFYKPT